MISGKIILKSATKVSLDKRFSDIAKLTPPTPTPRIQQQANVIIPHSRQELFGNRRPPALSAAARLKKRSINYRIGLGNNANVNRAYATPSRPRVFQRIGFNNRRRGGGGGGGNNQGAANSYLFGGQSGMGIRLRGQGRVGGTRTFRSRTRGYLNNSAISRFSGYSTRGNRNNNYNNNNNNNNNRGRRGGGNNNFNRPNRGARGGQNSNRGRGNGRNNNSNNKNNKNVTKEVLDTDLEKYMAQTNIQNDSIEMNAI